MDMYFEKKILIVDDEKDIRSLIKFYLKSFNADFYEAENSKRALEILNTIDIGVALIDIKMPGMNGLELLKEIAIKHPKTICIILTAWDAKEYILEALRNHAFDFLNKPIEKEILINRVRNALTIHSNKMLLEAAVMEFLINSETVTLQDFDKMSTVEKNSVLEDGLNKIIRSNFDHPVH